MKLLEQNHVKYGLLLTLILVVCLAVMELTGNNETFDNKSPLFVLYQFVAPAVVWYLGLRAKKDEKKGKLTYKEGVKEGFKMSLVFALVSPFVFWLYYMINPGILEYIKTTYQMPEATDASIIMIDMAIQFVSAIVFGTIYAAVIALFVRSKK